MARPLGMWSTVATAFKLALAHLDPPQLLLIANLTSCLVLALVLTFRGELPRLARLTRRQWLRAAFAGALNPFLYYSLIFKAYALLPAQEAQAINYTWAITLSLLAVPLLGQRLSGRDGLAIFLGYFGVVIIATRGNLTGLTFASPLGVVLALVSTVVWALSWILGARDDRAPVVALLSNFLCSLPLSLLAVCLVSDPLPASPVGLLAAAYAGTFEMGLAFVSWLSAMVASER